MMSIRMISTGLTDQPGARRIGMRMQPLLQPLQKRSLAQQAFEQLLAYVQDGSFRPGDPLPSQQELARRLTVSRPVLREAMQRLAAAGLIEIRHGSGCYVAQPRHETVFASLFDRF